MEDIDILGIHRNKKFSPNHIGNDDAIFSLTMKALENLGAKVGICSEDDFLSREHIGEQYIFTMARQKDAVKKLQTLEYNGVVVVNSGNGIENCYRTNMTNGLVDNGIPYPKSFVVPTTYTGDDVFDQLPGKGFWIKRGDFHAIHKEDVTFAYSKKEAKEIIKEYALRDIPDAVISEHLVGDLVKFYGVYDTDFFFWFYPYDNNHHKYAAYESINGKSMYHAFDENQLKQVAAASAEVLGIDIYGGDAIVGEDGSFHIIDLNDWPSFAPCRDEAAGYIAERIFERFTKLA
ncbi:hypothetical protein DYBT9275_01296 [Dyadobacter sp. CECT 9275]|uniref:ATP-grasp domain-containing protein n=1 Tax=Dyadobacter helix TaxID=2822344 RepID=A0A916J8N3_9BACT|nr:hypothetical protein [Dyadobacter sp. CECT 9275]CAG4994034.1 hypothetical protein DYBT9275_01296 [Dyadobacter sp. CECT 9275]